MSNNSNPNYFRLGIFVLSAIAVLIAIVLVFGGGRIFQSSFTIETYIKQSVTGLDTGAAVRFRGVKIGEVSDIGLSGDIYEQKIPFEDRRLYVVVRMKIFGDKVKDSQVKAFFEDNLRARVKSMGITGVNYIEFDLASADNAKNYPPLPYSWVPDYEVIPSLPNQADEIISGIQKMISTVNDLNVNGTLKKFDDLVANLNLILAGDNKGNQGIMQSVKDLNVLLERINKVTSKQELNGLMNELVATMVALRQTISSAQGDTSLTIENLRQASENLNEFMRIASESPSSLIWSEPPPKIIPPMNGVQK